MKDQKTKTPCNPPISFERMLDLLNKQGGAQDDIRMAAILTHDDMKIARSIAFSIYGASWRLHVVDIYDRFLQRQEASDE